MCKYCGGIGRFELNDQIIPCSCNENTAVKSKSNTGKAATKSTNEILKDTIAKLEKRIDYLTITIDNTTAATTQKKRQAVKKNRNEMQYCAGVLNRLRSQAAWIG